MLPLSPACHSPLPGAPIAGPAGKQADFAKGRLLTLNQKEHSDGQQVWQD